MRRIAREARARRSAPASVEARRPSRGVRSTSRSRQRHQPVEIAVVALDQQLVAIIESSVRRQRHGQAVVDAVGQQAVEDAHQRHVGLGQRLEEPVLLEELGVLRMADVRQVRVEDGAPVATGHGGPRSAPEHVAGAAGHGRWRSCALLAPARSARRRPAAGRRPRLRPPGVRRARPRRAPAAAVAGPPPGPCAPAR